MNWDTVQWLLGVVLFVAFLLIMLRGCGGLMGGMGCCGSRTRGSAACRGEQARGREPDERAPTSDRGAGAESGPHDRTTGL